MDKSLVGRTWDKGPREVPEPMNCDWAYTVTIITLDFIGSLNIYIYVYVYKCTPG